MTDEEKAEDYADKILSDSKYPFIFSKEKVKAYIIKVYSNSLKCCENAFNKGLEEGRKEKWHDLRKNPDDLPDTNREVLVLLWDYDNYHIGRYEEEYDDVIRENTYWHFDDFSIEKNKLDTVLGWFELPKFEN